MSRFDSNIHTRSTVVPRQETFRMTFRSSALVLALSLSLPAFAADAAAKPAAATKKTRAPAAPVDEKNLPEVVAKVNGVDIKKVELQNAIETMKMDMEMIGQRMPPDRKDEIWRGLLDETIVLWSGEFGRLPVSQNGTGRDHNRNAFSLLAAGGGFKAGFVHGETDEVGYRAAVDPVSVADLHATVLHLLGLDHEKLVYYHNGRAQRLTDGRPARILRDVLR
jgi:hypothetical protein